MLFEDFSDDKAYPVMALEKDFFGLVPVSVLLSALQVRSVVSVEVLEYPVLIPQAAVLSLWRNILNCGEVS